MNYVAAGAGPTILFVPGWCMPGWIFDRQVEALAARLRVVVMDPRGQGRSEVARTGYDPARRGRDVAEMIATIGAPRVVLAGWSLGVLDALSCVNATGDGRIAGLVLIDNSIGEGAPPPAGSGQFFRNLRTQRDRTVRGFCASMFVRSPGPDYLDRLAREAQRMPVEDSIKLLSYPRPREFWRDTIYATQRPVLYAVRPRWREQGELLVQKHPGAEMEVYDNAGHALFVDEAERFNASLQRFVLTKARFA
ncbi:alpha/beta fold hydrolase [Falsiroseomonas sp. HW251]|uniref:alpha/beta fold hydrolase n=1 Tax=Falsiroseomonas sp. HW251 TaxID=3390998 RepID=UPI003D323C87